jgi:glycosyltransferase involved in cell wall biosynthesis
MKIVHIIPGSGGTFYCQNCMRDNELIKALREFGNDVLMVPMYLPLNVDTKGIMGDTPVFYGAINIYLKEKFSFYRLAPVWLERLFDSERLLQLVAKKSGSTRASGLEEMTISMLMGENGRQASELDHLIQFLNKEIQPEVVHLSNALLLGLTHRLKKDLGTAVICSLQDENEWIDPMSKPYQKKVWELMAEKANDVDMFIAASQYYADRSKKMLNLPSKKVKVVYGGICLKGYQPSPLPLDPPVIGYLCRMSEYFGMGILVDAFIKLKMDSPFKNLKLYLTGGYTNDDKPFVEKVKRKLQKKGVFEDVVIFEEFDRENRIKFLTSLTLLSVPVPGGEAFGAYQVEALAAGVPIIETKVGGYPEFVEKTGGGIIYEPNDAEHLAEAIANLLSNPDKIRELGETGRKVVLDQFSMKQMAENIMGIYQTVSQK